MTMNLIRSSKAVAICALLCISSCPLSAADHLDLIIQSFRVENSTMDQALSELHPYGLLFSLEKQATAPDRLVSVDLQGKSIREILDALMPHDGGWSWEVYRTRARGGSRIPIINVYPTSRKRDKGYIMNTVIEQFEIERTQPPLFFPRLHEIVPELIALRRSALAHQTGEVGTRVIRVGVEGEDRPNELWLRAALYRLPLRAILNEVALVFGQSWMYEETSDAWPHRWRQF